MTAAEEATSSASAASRSCGMTSTRVRRISEGVLSRSGPQDWFRAFACVGRYHKLSGTVRPTKADVAARFIARNTAPAPEMGARALTWGAGEKVLLVLAAAGWRRAGRASRCGARAIMLCWSPWRRRCCPWFETSVRPDPTGPQNGDQAPPRCPIFQDTRGRLSFRPRAAHWGLGIGGRRLAGRHASCDPRRRGRHLADALSRPGALGEQCRRKVLHWERFLYSSCGCAPVTRSTLRRRTIMPTLEDLKGYAERATGLRRPGKRKAMDFAQARKPHTVRFKDDGLIPNHPRWPLVIYRHAVSFDERHDPGGRDRRPVRGEWVG